MASFVSLKELADFHSIDRQVYARLVIDKGLDPNLSKKIVAFWYWLERKGHKDLINMVLALSSADFNGLALEAIACLECLSKDLCFTISDLDGNISLPFMHRIVSNDFSLAQIYEKRVKGILIMDRFIKDVCDKIFIDIKPRNLANGFQIQPAMVTTGFQIIHPAMANYNGFYQVQPMVTNGVEQVQSMVSLGEPSDQVPQSCHEHGGQKDTSGVSNNDRTLFVTFSKGHPISKEELRDLILRIYGNCLEAIQMGPEPDPLYARVVVDSVSAIEKILGDRDMVKLSSNSKDVRVRRFIPNTNHLSSQQ